MVRRAVPKLAVLPKVKGGFGCIVADPPWPFSNQATRASTGKHYSNLAIWKIFNLPVEASAAALAHLYLWTTQTHLPLAVEAMGRWGFVFKTSLTWVKTKSIETVVSKSGAVDHCVRSSQMKVQIGLGNWYRHAHEICLFGVRGQAKANSKRLPDVIFAPRGTHSSKPEVLQDLAELMSPGPRLELFARRPRKGWNCWGDEVDGPKPVP